MREQFIPPLLLFKYSRPCGGIAVNAVHGSRACFVVAVWLASTQIAVAEEPSKINHPAKNRLAEIIASLHVDEDSHAGHTLLVLASQTAAECGFVVEAVPLAERISDDHMQWVVLDAIENELSSGRSPDSWTEVVQTAKTTGFRDRLLVRQVAATSAMIDLDATQQLVARIEDPYWRINALVGAATTARVANQDAHAETLVDLAEAHLLALADEESNADRTVDDPDEQPHAVELSRQLQMNFVDVAIEMYAQDRNDRTRAILKRVTSPFEREDADARRSEIDARRGDWRAALESGGRTDVEWQVVDILLETGQLAAAREAVREIEMDYLCTRIARHIARSGQVEEAREILRGHKASIVEFAIIDADAARGAAERDEWKDSLELLRIAIGRIESSIETDRMSHNDLILVCSHVLNTSAAIDPGLERREIDRLLDVMQDRIPYIRGVAEPAQFQDSTVVVANIRLLNAAARQGRRHIAEAAFLRAWSKARNVWPLPFYLTIAASRSGLDDLCVLSISADSNPAARVTLFHVLAFERQRSLGSDNLMEVRTLSPRTPPSGFPPNSEPFAERVREIGRASINHTAR